MESTHQTGLPAGVANAPSVFRFSTDTFPERERLAAWREFCGRGLLKLDLEPLEDMLHAEATLRAFPGLRIANGRGTGTRFDRPAHLIDNDDVMLGIVLSGQIALHAARSRRLLHAGDAVLMGGEEGGSSVAPNGFSFISLLMPMAVVAPTGRNAGDLLGRTIPAQTPALQLLTRYLGILDDERALATPALQRHVVTHIHDLAALAVRADREGADRRGMRAARLRAIKEEIMSNLGRGEVSVVAIAARHQVTPRHVQMLFEEEGTTFTDFVLKQRLARAHRMLTDPRYAGQKIAALAYEVGFNERSYFVRRFRRQYGMAPSEVREAALRAGAQPNPTIA